MQESQVPITRKQQLCNKLLNQIQYIQSEHDNLRQSCPASASDRIEEDLQEAYNKIQKIQSLNQKLERDQQRLKLQYIMLLKEKHTYVNKLKAIQNLGDNFDWDDQSGVLQKIKPLIQATKRRLKQSRGNGPHKN